MSSVEGELPSLKSGGDGRAKRGAAAVSRTYAWYLTVVLMLVYTLSFIDRKLPFILAESIKRDLKLNDTELGLLTGLAFTVVYALSALPLGKIVDRGPRKAVIVTAITVWSLMTALGGFATNFIQLALARAGVAVGEAACTPAAHSMLGDVFPPERRSSALAFFMIGAPLGILLGLWFGGRISDLHNWRIAMFAVGLPGLLMALLIATTVRRPQRMTSAASGPSSTVQEGFRIIVTSPVLRQMMIAGALATASNTALSAFGPAYVIRTFALKAGTTGLWIGLVTGVSGVIGSVAGGIVGDRFKGASQYRSLIAVGWGFVIAGPISAMAIMANSFSLFLVLLFAPMALEMFYAGPCFATLQRLAPPRTRGVTTAFYMMALSGVGAGLGPLLAGALSDILRPHYGILSLRIALVVLALVKIWGGLHYVLAGRRLGQAYRASGESVSA